MKLIKEILLADELEFEFESVGFCPEIERYVYKHRRAFVCEYYAYYFISKEQFLYLKEHREEFLQDRVAFEKTVRGFVEIGSSAGAEYIRDYACSPEFRSADHSPLPSRWDGPYLYDGERLCWDFFTGGIHYAVPVIDFNHRANIGEKDDFGIHYYDREEKFGFRGKPVTELEGI